MDFFYKPAVQRPDECKSLESNYMDCLLQKMQSDRVLVNKCKLDYILWFHLECPRAAAAFDDPDTFKLKWRNYFANKAEDMAWLFTPDKDVEKLRQVYDVNLAPDDVRANKEVQEIFKQYPETDPGRHPDYDMESDLEIDFGDNQIPRMPEVKYRHYGQSRPQAEMSTDLSARFGNAEKFAGKL